MKVVAELAVTDAVLTVVPLLMLVAGVKIIDFGAAPYVLLKVITTLQVEVWVLLPEVIVNEPAESVELFATVAVGEVAQAVGVPMVGLVVWVDLKWALVRVRLAKVVVLPATVIIRPLLSALNS